MKNLITILVLVCATSVVLAQSNLEVEGDLVIGQSNFEAPKIGTIRFNQEQKDFEGWNGVHWISLTSENQYGIVSDNEGNVYKTIKIGNQVWMAENLKARRYRNGLLVTLTQSNTNWR